MKQILAVAGFVLIFFALGASAQIPLNGTCASDPCGVNATCNDTGDGYYYCICEPGYMLVNLTDCEMCPNGTWGTECLPCNCTDNTTACDRVNGTCPEDIDACSNNPCGWNVLCNSTGYDNYTCYCEDGYWLNDTNCQMCPLGTWGAECSNLCNCPYVDDICHHVNGTCPMCEDDPCGTYAQCQNLNDTYVCYCEDGYYLLNDSISCERCPKFTWGEDCAFQCNCTDNTTGCNHVTGLCPEDEVNCASNPCGANALCWDLSEGYLCYCPTGYLLIDDYECKECPGGTWGPNCTNNCSCEPQGMYEIEGSAGNGCDNVNGNCLCNGCYTGEYCEEAKGADCIKDFLEIPEKCSTDLKNTYGGQEHPEPPPNTLGSLVVDLMELDNSAVVQVEPEFNSVSREDVDQGPLVKLTWTVNKNLDRPSAEAGLEKLTEQVKLGNIRSTLIINSQFATADVTLNAGIRRCQNDDDSN